ncbi:ankyrin repeat domain-containing protein [Herbidospora sp. RD11066]
MSPELTRWQRVRRFAVPGWMIEQATERRLAGDWQGACEAAGVGLAFDPSGLPAEVVDDLRHLVPDLLRAGRLSPGELHPLVRAALFPALPPTASGPRGPEPLLPVRVRCGGEWHEVTHGNGALLIPHSPEEQGRELAMGAFGGDVNGCFLAQRAWRSREGRLPKRLGRQRQDLLLYVQHGDTSAVLELLDAGFDPHVTDGDHQTLLHLLYLVDHADLLPRLLAAGLDVNGRDNLGRTPLHTAVVSGGSPELVAALRAAGARLDLTDAAGLTPADLIPRGQRTDLAALLTEPARDHSGIGTGRDD